MSIDRLKADWGLSKTPFTKELAPSMLFASAAHQEASGEDRVLIVPRVRWGWSAARSAPARPSLPGPRSRLSISSRHTIIYLANPAVGARGIYFQIVERSAPTRGSIGQR